MKLKKLPTKQDINPNEYYFTTDTNALLIAENISTSIVFTVRGTFFNDDEEKQAFCGIYYWSGFADNSPNFKFYAENTLCEFFTHLQTTFRLEETSPIMVNELKFIGGEKRQVDKKTNEVTLSGTEQEVAVLNEVVKNFNFNEFNITLAPNAIKHRHFLTEGEQIVDVKLNTYYCNIKHSDARTHTYSVPPLYTPPFGN